MLYSSGCWHYAKFSYPSIFIATSPQLPFFFNVLNILTPFVLLSFFLFISILFLFHLFVYLSKLIFRICRSFQKCIEDIMMLVQLLIFLLVFSKIINSFSWSSPYEIQLYDYDCARIPSYILILTFFPFNSHQNLFTCLPIPSLVLLSSSGWPYLCG